MKPLLIVDGYNIIGYRDRSVMAGDAKTLDEHRDRLKEHLQDYAGYTDEEVILVFDGYQSDRLYRSEEKYGNLTVVFTKHGETADSYIERITAKIPPYQEVRVATSDALEQSQIFSTGAIRVSAKELTELLYRTRSEGLDSHQRMTYANRKNSIEKRLPEGLLKKLEELRRAKE